MGLTKRDKHSKFCRLTNEDKEFIKKHFGRGKLTNTEIARYIGCDVHTVSIWGKRLGMERGDIKIISADNDQYLRDNYGKMPIKEIAKHYGCHYTTISAYIRDNDIQLEPLPDTITLNGVKYKRVTDTLHVSRDGKILSNGKPLKTTMRYDARGKKVTAQVNVMVKGCKQYYQLSRLVAKAWKRGYTEDCYILYKDENIHNVDADNLIIANEKQYTAFIQRNSGYSAIGVEQRKEKIQHVIDEASITLHYLKTADITPLNKYVEKRLYPLLMEWVRDKFFWGQDTIMRVVPECIAVLYEVILRGACMYNYERYCKKMLMNYKKNGTFGRTGRIPKQIQIIVEQLNTDCLCQKYKVRHQK